MSDKRTDAEVRESIIKNLIRDGMPADLAPRATDAWINLLSAAPHFADMKPYSAIWLQYMFMQGFVAGSVATVHHN